MAQAAPFSPDRTPEGWGSVARAYDDRIAPFLAQYAEDALRLTDLRAGERVLDVAAGSGALSIAAARRGADVLATDFAPQMVERLRERAKDVGVAVTAEVMDGQALDVPAGSFDAAYSNFGLIFFPDRMAGFRSMRRALRPGGRCAVTAWAPPERIDWFVAFGAGLARVDPDRAKPAAPPAVFSLADPDVLRREMTEAGFRDVRVETVRHEWDLASPEEGWTTLTTTNPVIPILMGSMPPERVEALHREMLKEYARWTKDGRIVMSGEAHVGIGTA